MPWKTTCLRDQRHRFVRLCLRRRKPLSTLCAEWALARKTAYKWLARYEQEGRAGLHDRSHAAAQVRNRPAARWLARIRRWRSRHPRWGAPKLHAALGRRFGPHGLPSEPAIGRWLKAWRLTRNKKRRRTQGPTCIRPGLTQARRPNEVWTVDFKGWFRTGEGRRVEPLTVRDLASRLILAVILQKTTRVPETLRSFEKIFRERGLPRAIRCDNGTPFGASGALGLTRLSAWWVRLGIRVEFIEPGRPDQNGAHEQVHRVYKEETLAPPARTLAAQKRRTRAWIKTYNHERPHEALGMQVPAQLYQASRRKLPARLRPWRYPKGWLSRRVKGKGMIPLYGRMRYIGEAFENERVGLKRKGAQAWEVYFGPHLIGELDCTGSAGIRAVRYRKKRKRGTR